MIQEIEAPAQAFDSAFTNQSKTATNWLTAKEASTYLKIAHRTLLAWARQGKVKGHVLSGVQRQTWRFRQSDLDACLSESACKN